MEETTHSHDAPNGGEAMTLTPEQRAAWRRLAELNPADLGWRLTRTLDALEAAERERDEWQALTITPRGAQHYIERAKQAEAERDTLRQQLAASEAHNAELSREGLQLAAERTFFLGKDIPETIERARAVLVERVREAEAQVQALRAENETLTMKLVACGGVAAMMNTRESAQDRIDRDHPYWSVSYGDVVAAVEREMSHREHASRLETALRDVIKRYEDYQKQPIRTFNPADEAKIQKQEEVENVLLDIVLRDLRAALTPPDEKGPANG